MPPRPKIVNGPEGGLVIVFSLKSLFGRKPELERAHALYTATIHAARRPAIYTEMGVPDTPEGRFEILALMAFLVLRRLKTEEQARGVSQAYFDIMFEDIDSNLRELGVGDISVGKKVKKLAQSFYGRIKAYEEALAGDDAQLEAALRKHPYRNMEPMDAHVSRLAGHVRREDAYLAQQPVQTLLVGEIAFAPIDTVQEGAQ